MIVLLTWFAGTDVAEAPLGEVLFYNVSKNESGLTLAIVMLVSLRQSQLLKKKSE